MALARKQNMRYRRYSASSLTDSLRSVVRLRRAEGTGTSKDEAMRDDEREKNAAVLPVFHRLRPPDKHHRI